MTFPFFLLKVVLIRKLLVLFSTFGYFELIPPKAVVSVLRKASHSDSAIHSGFGLI